MNRLEPQAISVDTGIEKYFKGTESTIGENQARIASGIAAVEKNPKKWKTVFQRTLQDGLVMAGRISSCAGTDINATWINCFVEPVGDCLVGVDEDGYPGIYEALREASVTMSLGGGEGYGFSRIRPRGSLVKSKKALASGPVSYMHVFDKSCETIESAGSRRGAQMGILRVDHPDIEEFIHAKDEEGVLRNFNISVAATDEFMTAIKFDTDFQLVHKAQPSPEQIENGAFQRKDGMWVYRTVKAVDLMNQIMQSTYDHAEPGFFLIDTVNKENNLSYCETIEACNPCAEQPLPAYGCCDLGSINLTRFVTDPFTAEADFDWDGFAKAAGIGVRMLDNVLDGTVWPLEKQQQEAQSKRRIGLGFLGLGDALIMLGHRYDTVSGRGLASRIAELLCTSAYWASVELAKERGAFPLFDREQYCQSPFIKRLPADLQAAIYEHGIRNSHLVSIAPTGTISLVYADNASNGIEPAFSWFYDRKKRMPDGSQKVYQVEDHAFRLYKHVLNVSGDPATIAENLPEAFVSAMDISAIDHQKMVAAVQPFIDSAISKTVNVPEDYPFEDFKNLYMETWRTGGKGLATYRPNDITGSVLSVSNTDNGKTSESPCDIDDSDPDRRLRLDSVPEPTMKSLRFPKRPDFPNGNPAWCYDVKHPEGTKFSIFVGHIQNGEAYPFEVWVNGTEQPRGLGALAKTLSFDMYSRDRAWLKHKLDALARAKGDDGFELQMPPEGERRYVPSTVSGFAQLVRYRCEELGAFDDLSNCPVMDALMSEKEPKAGTNGTLSWTVDILNGATGDDFLMGLKELVLPNGERRPYSVWLSGEYPRIFDGLCKALSFDMRVIDPAWIGLKLRKLANYSEPMGHFMAFIPGKRKQTTYPSTVAYIAKLMIHRHAMLGILDDEGYPIEAMGILDNPHFQDAVEDVRLEETLQGKPRLRSVGAAEVRPGSLCPDCSTYSLMKVDGCDRCVSCGYIGSCG